MERNINDTNLDENLYNELLLVDNIYISPDKFNNKINLYLEELLKKKVEQKCISEGYVKKDSVDIIKKSLGILRGSQFNGYINYNIIYKALVCSPKNGSVINCKVKLINNKLGILGNNGPLTIIVGKQLHNKPELLDEVNIDDVIEIRVIETKYSINDKEIRILGKLNIDDENTYKKTNNIEVDEINDIDVEDVDDNTENQVKENIDDIDLESLDDLSSDEEDINIDDDEEEDIEDIDEMDDEMDEDQDDNQDENNLDDIEEDTVIDDSELDDEEII